MFARKRGEHTRRVLVLIETMATRIRTRHCPELGIKSTRGLLRHRCLSRVLFSEGYASPCQFLRWPLTGSPYLPYLVDLETHNCKDVAVLKLRKKSKMSMQVPGVGPAKQFNSAHQVHIFARAAHVTWAVPFLRTTRVNDNLTSIQPPSPSNEASFPLFYAGRLP